METSERKPLTIAPDLKAQVENQFGGGATTAGQVSEAVNDSNSERNAAGPEGNRSNAEASMRRDLSELETARLDGENEYIPTAALTVDPASRSASLADQLSLTSLFRKLQSVLAKAHRRANRQKPASKAPASDLLPSKSLSKRAAGGLRQAATGLNPNAYKSSDDPGFDISA